jgi:hypothetical protein
MFRLFKWLYIIAFLFFVKLAVELYFNVLISQKYNAFSETDIQFIKNLIVYTIILNISSLVVLFFRRKIYNYICELTIICSLRTKTKKYKR